MKIRSSQRANYETYQTNKSKYIYDSKVISASSSVIEFLLPGMLSKRAKQTIIGEYRINDKDTGSIEAQVALLTHNIKSLTGHLKTAKKDFHSRRGLLQMVGKQRRLLAYLERRNPKTCEALCAKLGISR